MNENPQINPETGAPTEQIPTPEQTPAAEENTAPQQAPVAGQVPPPPPEGMFFSQQAPQQQAPTFPQQPLQQPPYSAPQAPYNQAPNAGPAYSQQPPYAPPSYAPYQAPYWQEQAKGEVVSIGEWLWSLLLMLIPCVNLVMLFVFAFGSQRKNKQTFFKAALILYAILIGVGILLSVALIGLGASIFSQMGEFYY